MTLTYLRRYTSDLALNAKYAARSASGTRSAIAAQFTDDCVMRFDAISSSFADGENEKPVYVTSGDERKNLMENDSQTGRPRVAGGALITADGQLS